MCVKQWVVMVGVWMMFGVVYFVYGVMLEMFDCSEGLNFNCFVCQGDVVVYIVLCLGIDL